ncbi:MAG: hypothetical protein ABFD86_23725, partial [Bryobacteraceae bacterium]
MSATLVREFVRPAVRALPSTMARRLGCCRIFLRAAADSSVTSQWTETEVGLDVSVMTGGCDD